MPLPLGAAALAGLRALLSGGGVLAKRGAAAAVNGAKNVASNVKGAADLVMGVEEHYAPQAIAAVKRTGAQFMDGVRASPTQSKLSELADEGLSLPNLAGAAVGNAGHAAGRFAQVHPFTTGVAAGLPAAAAMMSGPEASPEWEAFDSSDDYRTYAEGGGRLDQRTFETVKSNPKLMAQYYQMQRGE